MSCLVFLVEYVHDLVMPQRKHTFRISMTLEHPQWERHKTPASFIFTLRSSPLSTIQTQNNSALVRVLMPPNCLNARTRSLSAAGTERFTFHSTKLSRTKFFFNNELNNLFTCIKINRIESIMMFQKHYFSQWWYSINMLLHFASQCFRTTQQNKKQMKTLPIYRVLYWVHCVLLFCPVLFFSSS